MPRARNENEESKNPDLSLSSIGNYAIIKTVGQGNFAKVKLAKHSITDLMVAIKVIDKTSLDEKKLSKLYREVRIMKMLNHPNIVIETKNTMFLVMEYASGGELYDYLVVHGKLKEKEARLKFRQILSAVSYCHGKRVIHRDLKAENLLLDSNLNIKIADFGFSNLFDPDHKLDTFCGSPPYAAPELFQGRRYTGPEVDIWSLGVILYVLTTGCLPFDGKNLQEMRETVCRGKYRIPFYLSDTCEKLLRKFLIRDPSRRSSLDIIIDDVWINEGFKDSPISTDISLTVVEDESIINILQHKYGMDPEVVRKTIRENVYDDVAAIYFLLYWEKNKKVQSQEAEDSGPPAASPTAMAVSAQSAFPSNNPNIKKNSEEDVHEGGDTIVDIKARKKNQADSQRRRRFTVAGDADMQNGLGIDDKEVTSQPPKLEPTPSNLNSRESVDREDKKPEIKKRASIISGIFRTPLRRPSQTPMPRTDREIPSSSSTSSSTIDKPRALRFTFNSATTSTKNPQEIIQILSNALDSLHISYRVEMYLLVCTFAPPNRESVKFEVEVCRLPRLSSVFGLRFRRINGSSSDYKDVCERVLASVNI